MTVDVLAHLDRFSFSHESRKLSQIGADVTKNMTGQILKIWHSTNGRRQLSWNQKKSHFFLSDFFLSSCVCFFKTIFMSFVFFANGNLCWDLRDYFAPPKILSHSVRFVLILLLANFFRFLEVIATIFVLKRKIGSFRIWV